MNHIRVLSKKYKSVLKHVSSLSLRFVEIRLINHPHRTGRKPYETTPPCGEAQNSSEHVRGEHLKIIYRLIQKNDSKSNRFQ